MSLFTFALARQQGQKAKEAPTADGKETFASRCGMCHGVDGRGGEHAPSIASGAATQLSEADLQRVLHDGIPARGMPSFKELGPGELRQVEAYVRVLQGRGGEVAVKGDPDRGRALFYGPAHCADCHSIGGQGGFLGPDLSVYSRSHSPQKIKQAIVDPSGNTEAEIDTVTIVTRDGRKLVGVARNEDNFSVQLQTLDGSFHLLMKSDLASLDHNHRSLMPSDYGTRLSAGDLDNLISFLVASGAKSGEMAARKEYPEAHM